MHHPETQPKFFTRRQRCQPLRLLPYSPADSFSDRPHAFNHLQLTMKTKSSASQVSPSRQPQEIELKLALPTADAAGLQKQLARLPVLARRKAHQQPLHNVYYDTPDDALHRQRMALRLRRTGSALQPEWLQTFKTGGSGSSALSQRGEWETGVSGQQLDLAALQATPWAAIDADGSLFRSLVPRFETSFERTSWTVRRRDGSAIEVALDIGHIEAEGRRIPLCELELELLAGPPAALFALARQIAASIAVLPEHRSKAERGHALAAGALGQPLRAAPPLLDKKMSPASAAQCVLREMFSQFTANLATLRQSDDPELIHQARVGWRRFKSAHRLFRPALQPGAAPSLEPLQTLLVVIGELRDMDVARTETLPRFADAYRADSASRAEKWQQLAQDLAQACRIQRKAVCFALETPAVGATLLAITEWLETLEAMDKGHPAAADVPLRPWARGRVARLHKQLKSALKDASTPDSQHRARILAKRLRYGIEALKPLLDKRRARRWHQEATRLQTGIGGTRDVLQAGVVLSRLEADRDVAEFMRGVAAGQASHAGTH
ncbi:MAG: adenylate cyclase [Polaromonas sp.]|nr:adenylate cyclase [Polaromonas sp.]